MVEAKKKGEKDEESWGNDQGQNMEGMVRNLDSVRV